MGKPLEGMLVVALEQAVTAPLCSSRLVDAGARVIKIERPEGDFARNYDKAARGMSSYFVWLNRGKESLVLDLKQPADRSLMDRLLARADVFLQNLAPGAAQRLGLGAAELRARYPRLVTCAITGYGETGPYRDRKAYDLLIQAETGLAYLSGPPEAPGRVGVSVSDIAAGLNAYAAILEALLARGRTGEGADISLSLFDATAEWMAVPLLHYDYGGKAPERVGLKHPSIAPYGAFATRDGREILISIQNEREWVQFCADILGDARLPGDSRFSDNNRRVANRPALDALVAAVFAAEDREVLGQKLEAAAIAFANLNRVEDLSRHPHLRRFSADTPAGEILLPIPPALRAEDTKNLRVPQIGEHGAAIRQEFAAA